MIKVDNLNNLFWDNGTYKVPNTYPQLIQGKILENTTPVMITHLTGWIVLTGDWNYAEYKGNLFFLKKDKLISETDNKWRYILIKDQLCSILKNKANVIAQGTLINTDLNHLNKNNFQFTLPAFNLFAERILIPLEKNPFNWKTDLQPQEINKELPLSKSVSNKWFTKFIDDLESNKRQFSDLTNFLNNNKYFCILGKPKREDRPKNWKNELRDKINDLLRSLGNDDIWLGQVGNRTFQRIFQHYTIGPNTAGLSISKIENQAIKDIDLTGLKDIKEIDIASLSGEEFATEETSFPIGLDYDNSLLVNLDDQGQTYVKKLTRKVRLSFSNLYSTRATFYSTKWRDSQGKGNKYYPWFWDDLENKELFYPQKVFFHIETNPLQPQDKWKDYFPKSRQTDSFRSVYLYYVYNWDFLFYYQSKTVDRAYEKYDPAYKGEVNFVDPQKYFTGTNAEVRKELASGEFLKGRRDKEARTIELKEGSQEYYPWNISDPKWENKHLNVGWLIGQFTQFDEANANKFHGDFPFVVIQPATQLKRITGLKDTVKNFIQNPNIYKGAEDNNEKYDLDIFNTLPPRARHNSKEEDFLIGEKLLFWTWGLPIYLLFQPFSKISSIDPWYDIEGHEAPELPLLKEYLTGGSWFWGYSLFDKEGAGYLTTKAKQLFKKAYENFEPLEYNQQFYFDKEKYKLLEQHIRKNTNSFFKLDSVNFEADTPFKEALKTGDIFYSDLDWYYFDSSEDRILRDTQRTDFLYKLQDKTVNLEDGDLIVYCEPTSHKLFLGTVQNWDSEIELPAGQFIVTGEKIHEDHVADVLGAGNKLTVKYTRIKKLLGKDNKYSDGFTSFDALISTLKEDSAEIFKGIAEFDLQTLRRKNPTKFFLFDLVGTDFYCLLDKQDKVTLIVKEEAKTRLVGEYPKMIYRIKASKKIQKLEKVQWVNQKVVLSVYGEKIDLPIKAIEGQVATIEIDTGTVPDQSSAEVFEPIKIEVKHALGKLYYRFDRERDTIKKAELANIDMFGLQDINIQQRRNTQDYLLNRERFEISRAEMQIAHDQQRLEWAQSHTNSWLGIIGGIAGAIAGVAGTVATAGVGAGMLAGGIGTGVISSFFKGATNIGYGFAKRGLMDRRFETDIQRKNLESYTIDLTFARQKLDHRLLLRRVFSQIALTRATSRERSKALDKFELDLGEHNQKEIYLEVWTASKEQLEYLEDFHKKHGVDCRIPLGTNFKGLSIKNGIEEGIYTMEDVEILNLKDRIDLMFLKTRLEIGMKFVNWKEHELVGELIPVDPRITKLQKALKISEEKQIQLEQDKNIQKQQIEGLRVEIESEHKKVADLNTNLDTAQKDLKKTKQTLDAKEQQLQRKTEEYTSLSNNYRRKEQEANEQKKLANLYKDESQGLRTSLSGERQKTKQLEKEKSEIRNELDSTKDKNRELEGENSQLNTDLQEEKKITQRLTTEKEDINQKLSDEKKETTRLKKEGEDKDREIQQMRNKNRQYLSEIRNTIHLLRETTPTGIKFPITIGERQITQEEELIREANFSDDLQKAKEYLKQELEKQKSTLEKGKTELQRKLDDETHAKEQEQREKESLRSQLSQKEEENRSLKSEQENINQEKSVLTDQVQNQLTQIRDKENEINRLKQEKDNLQKSKDELQKDRNWWHSEGQKKQKAERERDSARQELQQCKTEKEQLSTQIATLTSERDEARQQQGTKAGPEIWREKGFEQVNLSADYVIVTCPPKRMLTTNFNKEKFAWVKDNSIQIKENPNRHTIRAIKSGYTDYVANNWLAEFSKKITTYADFKSKMKPTDPKQKYAWSGNLIVSDQGEIGFPWFESAPSNKEARLACTRYYSKEKGWLIANEEGATEVTNYGQYLNVLGLDLVNNKVITKGLEAVEKAPVDNAELNRLTQQVSQLQKQIEEKDNTIKAIREIETTLREGQSDRWATVAMGEMLRNCLNFGNYPVYFVKTLNDQRGSIQRGTMEIFKWDGDYCCYVKEWAAQKIQKWNWYFYGDNSTKFGFYKFENDNFRTVHLRNFRNSGYEYDPVSQMSFDDFETHVNVGRWLVKVWCDIPNNVYPLVGQRIGTGSTTLDNLRLIEPVWWNSKTRQWNKGEPTEGQKKLTLYKEYLEFMGLKWNDKRKKTVPKSLLEEDLPEEENPDDLGITEMK